MIWVGTETQRPGIHEALEEVKWGRMSVRGTSQRPREDSQGKLHAAKLGSFTWPSKQECHPDRASSWLTGKLGEAPRGLGDWLVVRTWVQLEAVAGEGANWWCASLRDTWIWVQMVLSLSIWIWRISGSLITLALDHENQEWPKERHSPNVNCGVKRLFKKFKCFEIPTPKPAWSI